MVVVCLAVSVTNTWAQLTVTNNLVLWLKADALSLTNGQAVSAWADSSTSGNNTSQGAITNQPAFHTGLFNGLPGVTFDGNSDFLGLTRVSLPAGLTYFAVFRTTNTDAASSYPLNAPLTIIGDHTDLIENGFGLSGGHAQYNNFTGQNTRVTGTIALSDGAPHVIAVTHATNAPGPANLYVNGLSDGSMNSSYRSTFVGFDRISGGANVSPCCTGTEDLFQGDLAEILVYNTVLTGAQRGDVYEYFVAKYALPEPGSVTLIVLALFALRTKLGRNPRSRG
jgi:hypothetical protein